MGVVGELARTVPARRSRRRLLCLAAALFVLPNALAFFHARAMTRFQAGAKAPPRPEAMSISDKLTALVFGVRVPRPENRQTPADFDLEFETTTVESEPGVVLEAWRIACAEPRGTVVLFHGYAASKSEVLSDARLFHELGYEAVLVDFRGSGGSTGDYTTLGVEEARDVAAVWLAETRVEAARPVILFGRSMGAAAVLRAIARHGVSPSAAVVQCPFDRMSTAVSRRCEALGAPTFPTTALLLFWGGLQLGFNPFTHNPVDYARDTACPVLILQGDADPRVKVSDVEEIADSLAGRSRLVLFEGCGHDACSRHDPDLFRETVGGFLRTIE